MQSGSVHAAAVVTALVMAMLGTACAQSRSPMEQTPATTSIAVAGSDSAPAGVSAPPAIQVNSGELIVLGIISTPDPCQRLRAFGERRDDALTVVVEATSTGGNCVTVLGSFAYRFATPWSSGSQRVRVEHRYVNTGWSTEVVRDTVVTVP